MRFLPLFLAVAVACGTGNPGTSTTSSTLVSDTTQPALTTVPPTTSPPSTGATTTTLPGVRFEFTIQDGVVEGPERVEVNLGDEVVLVVTSDVADEVHLHTYDVMVDVEAGETVELSFTADIPGIFEVELEDAELPITEVEVAP